MSGGVDFAARGLALAYTRTSGAAKVGTGVGSNVESQLRGYATRAEIRALAPVAGATVRLTEKGREGRFSFEIGNLAARVTADPEEGLTIAPQSDPTGASGAWTRIHESKRVMAAWFGWSASATGTANKVALQAAMRAADSLFAYAPQGCAIVDLGTGSFDLGATGDLTGVERIKCHVRGHGPFATQIVWKGDKNATVVQWESAYRGRFTGVRFRNGSATTRPRHWIDTTHNAGTASARLTDWGDSFANFYDSVSDHAGAAALKFGEIVNYDDRGLRFQGGTRHILITQPTGGSTRRGFRLSDYTFDYSDGSTGVFSEHILVDITGNGYLQLDLAPARCEGTDVMAGTNPALVRVTDTQGPNLIGAEAVTVIYRGGGIQFRSGSNCWLVYQETTQAGGSAVHTNVILPHGIFLSGFQGLQGGNWNATHKGVEPVFTANTILPPWTSARAPIGYWPYLGRNPRFKGALQGDTGVQVMIGAGNPEGTQSAAKGSLFMRTDGGAGFVLYAKSAGTEAAPTTAGWVNLTPLSGAISGTTDAAGDITVTHGLGGAPVVVLAQASGTTVMSTQPHTIGASTFKVRFRDAAGAVLASSAVTGSWLARA